jgi:hypothetical protein
MTEPKPIPFPKRDPTPHHAPELDREHTMDSPERPATILAFGLVALVSMVFGFVVGLFF